MGISAVFYWDNFGPMHIDRILAVKKEHPEWRVIALELNAKSQTYKWEAQRATEVEWHTLFQGQDNPGPVKRYLKLLKTSLRTRARNFFLCNYEDPATLFLALTLRMVGKRVFVMGVSKFDDQKRYLMREVGKSIFMTPYHGAIGSGTRPKDYLRFLGINEANIYGEYNTLSIDRIRRQANEPSAPSGRNFAERYFVAIARFVPKKNLHMLLEAFARYRKTTALPRRLKLCGSGLLEESLRHRAMELSIGEYVDFTGFVQTEEVSSTLAGAVCLLLPSVEEQFGNVVIEAQAMGLPAIVSENCGARDSLIRNAVNGFVVEPDNPIGLAWFMCTVGDDEQLWRQMSLEAANSATLGDVSQFVHAVQKLTSASG